MNRKQKICLWLGITVFGLMGLFPPFISPEPYWTGGRPRFYQFILYTYGNIDISRLCIQWAMVVVVTASLIYILKVKTEQTIINRNQKIVLWIGIIIFFVMCLFPPYGYRKGHEDFGPLIDAGYTFFFLDFYHTIKGTKLLIQCGIVAIIIGALIYALKDRNKPQHVGEKPESMELTIVNRNQKIVLCVGITVIILWGLFPLFISPEPYWIGGRPRYYQSIIDLDIIRLCIQLIIIAVITGGLVATLADKKPKDE
jgi:hypothetical protein